MRSFRAFRAELHVLPGVLIVGNLGATTSLAVVDESSYSGTLAARTHCRYDCARHGQTDRETTCGCSQSVPGAARRAAVTMSERRRRDASVTPDATLSVCTR